MWQRRQRRAEEGRGADFFLTRKAEFRYNNTLYEEVCVAAPSIVAGQAVFVLCAGSGSFHKPRRLWLSFFSAYD